MFPLPRVGCDKPKPPRPTPGLAEHPTPMYPHSPLDEGLREEISKTRALLRDKERRRDDLIAQTAASRLRDDPSQRGKVAGWVIQSAPERRLNETEQLNREIEQLIRQIAALCNCLSDNPHGTPGFDFAESMDR